MQHNSLKTEGKKLLPMLTMKVLIGLVHLDTAKRVKFLYENSFYDNFS